MLCKDAFRKTVASDDWQTKRRFLAQLYVCWLLSQNVRRSRKEHETWEPITTATEICLNLELTETTVTQTFVCRTERYPDASNDNIEGFQQPLSGKPSSIFIRIHRRPRLVPRCTLVVCSHGYVPMPWCRPGSMEWIGVGSPPPFFCSLPPREIQPRHFLSLLMRSVQHWSV